jgi:hypothetical protein
MKITAVSQLGFVEEKKKQRRWRSVCLPSQGIGQFKKGGLSMGQENRHFIRDVFPETKETQSFSLGLV